jgi:putative spermidine/putrescine transport system permease protein
MKVPPWVGVAPFLLFAFLFLLLPSGMLLVGAFFDREGSFTLQNLVDLGRPNIVAAYAVTLELSAVTALGGVVLGFLLAWSVTLGGLPRNARGLLSTFSGVASNFAGVPLAFAFVATLGRVGLVTALLKTTFGIDLYDSGFNLYSFAGLALTYLYFQVPLMVLVITPSLEGMKREWREASLSLGANRFTYWMRVGLPVLAPALLASFLLLFGNAFGAYATAYALTGGLINLIPILIGAQIRGDVLHNPPLGYALALGMVALMALAIVVYQWAHRRAARWGVA